MKAISIFLVLVASITIEVNAQEIQYIFPEDGGIVNVTQAPYNADNSGLTDATEAIQAALSAYPNGNRTIYLPNGTYLISNTLEWPAGSGGNTYKRTMLQGESKSGTIIQLKDNCAGFQDPSSRKAMIYTGPAPAQRFRNAIRSLSVNTGNGNPGAAGIQFNCSNEGTMQHVNIISGDGQGTIGLDLDFVNEIGPGYILDLYVEGFDYGVRHGYAINSMTFENISLKDQKICAFFNEGNVSMIRGFKSVNGVRAIVNNWIGATMILIDADISGGGDSIPAIQNAGTLYARNISRTGYKVSILSTEGLSINVDNENIREYNSHALFRQFDSPVNSLNLPVEDMPEVAWSKLSDWVNVMTFGAVGDGSTDDRQAIQDAIDSGAETVYFPGGYKFNFNDTLYIRGAVKRIIGLEGKISGTGTFLATDEMADTVVLERLNALYSAIDLVNKSSKTLVMNSITQIPVRSEGSGDMFLSNIVISTLRLNNPNQSVWIRHINTESGDFTNIINNGSKLWILGHKTERGKTKIHTLNGGQTELLGSHNYSTTGEKTDPWYIVEDASLSIVGARETNFNSAPYSEYVKEIRGGETKIIERTQFPENGLGAAVIPLYSGYSVVMDPPTRPTNLMFNQQISNEWLLSWDDVPGNDLDYYSIYISDTESGPFEMIYNYLENPSYLFKAPDFGTYYFKVSAVDIDGFESQHSEAFEAVIEEPGPPAAPTGLVGIAGEGVNTIYWDPNKEPEFDHYEIYRALPPGTLFLPLDENVSDTLFQDYKLIAGSDHLYTIRAVNVYGVSSDFSDTITLYPVGIENYMVSECGLDLYPNPAVDKLYLQFARDSNVRDISLIDHSGRLIGGFEREGQLLEIDLQNLSPGIYYIRMDSEFGIQSRKFVRTKQ